MNFAGSVSGPGDPPPKPIIEVLLKDKHLFIEYDKDKISVEAKTSRKPDQPDKQPDPKKPDQPDKQPDPKKPDQPDKQPDPQQPDKDDNPTPSGPTAEEIQQAKDKLTTAKNSGDKEQIKNALNETSGITSQTSDADLKALKDEAETKLGKLDKLEMIKIIREEVKKVLEENGLKVDDLGSTKQKFDDLNNNNNDISQAQTIREEVKKVVGETSLDKLIKETEESFKKGDKKQIESSVKKLKEFSESQTDYKKSAYEVRKSKVKELLEKAKNKKQDSPKQGFFRADNPGLWISSIAITGFIGGVVWVASSRSKKRLKD